jgi:hypothetical protein
MILVSPLGAFMKVSLFVQVRDFITVRPELKHKSVTADEDNK